jgi:hypothetical protein
MLAIQKTLTGTFTKLFGSEARIRFTALTPHPIHPYAMLTGEVYVAETVLPFKLPVRQTDAELLDAEFEF